MPENTTHTENHDLIQTAQEAVQPHQLSPGIWLIRRADGGYHHLDLTGEIENAQPNPTRKTGRHTVVDVPSLTAYLTKHGTPETELWGARDAGTIKAVINAHDGGQNGKAGWGDHTATLTMRHSEDWKEWIQNDGKWLSQVDFAEFVENHLPNFGKPSGAEALELAQSFRATQKVEFGTTKHAGGETTLSYVETTDAKASTKKGEIAFPDKVILGVHVYDQGKAYPLGARLRYRVRSGELVMGYKLDRPRDVLQQAFNDVVTAVQGATGRDVWATA